LTTVAILQARCSSTRLPGKVLLPILGAPMLSRQIDRVQRAKTIDQIVVATSLNSEDDAIEAMCVDRGVNCFRGSLDDVLGRFNACAEAYGADIVVRLTGDCPLADPDIIDLIVQSHVERKADYTSNVHPPTWPDGLDVEVLQRDVLTAAAAEAKLASEREHVTSYIVKHHDRFRMSNVALSPDRSDLRLTVDEQVDFELVSKIFEAFLPANPTFGYEDVLSLLDANSGLLEINAGISRNHGSQNPVDGHPHLMNCRKH